MHDHIFTEHLHEHIYLYIHVLIYMCIYVCMHMCVKIKYWTKTEVKNKKIRFFCCWFTHLLSFRMFFFLLSFLVRTESFFFFFNVERDSFTNMGERERKKIFFSSILFFTLSLFSLSKLKVYNSFLALFNNYEYF